MPLTSMRFRKNPVVNCPANHAKVYTNEKFQCYKSHFRPGETHTKVAIKQKKRGGYLSFYKIQTMWLSFRTVLFRIVIFFKLGKLLFTVSHFRDQVK